jgi:photosystem II stability/assembly factor-like uncharacterized protein
MRGLTNASLVAVFTDRDGTNWVGGNTSLLLRREPGGDWTTVPISVSGIVTGIWQDAAGHLLVAAGAELLEKSLNSDEWTLVPIGTDALLLDIWGLDGERIFVGGTGGTIVRRVADEWLPAVTPVGDEIWGFAGTSIEDLVAVGQNGTILESNDAGATWVEVPSPTTRTLFAVAADGAGRVVAVGSGGTVLLRDGDTWEVSAAPTELNLFEVRSSGPGQFILAGDGGLLFEGDGLSWQRIENLGMRENFRGITGPPGARIAAGWYGTVLDEATGWKSSVTGTRVYGIHAPAGETAMAVGQGGVAYERRNGVWQLSFIPGSASLFAIDGPTGSDRIAVGDSGSVLHFDGASWHPESVPANGLLRSVWYDGRRAMVVGAEGTVLVREEGNWRAVASGTTRFLRHVGGREWGRLYVAGDSGTVLRWNGERFDPVEVPAVQNLRASWVHNPRDVYVVGDGGTILHYDGWSWSRVFPPTLNDIRAIHSVDNILYIAGDFGQLWRFNGVDWLALPSDQPGFWLALAGVDELIAVGELGTIAEGVR